MATYAAYRHVELDKIGYGKRRVLKPPGGGTSELFNAANGEEEKIRIAQNIAALNQEPSASNGTEKNDDPDKPEAIVSVVEPVGDVPLPFKKAEEPKKTVSSISRNCVTGDGCQTGEHFAIRVHRQRDGNPVTGEGYDLAKSASTQNNAAGPAAPSKARVPPGGYSSGLW